MVARRLSPVVGLRETGNTCEDGRGFETVFRVSIPEGHLWFWRRFQENTTHNMLRYPGGELAKVLEVISENNKQHVALPWGRACEGSCTGFTIISTNYVSDKQHNTTHQ